jgi:hypothetical protein
LLNRIVILLLLVQALHAAPGKLVLAVGTFDSNGVPASDVNILVDRLRNELMNAGTFRVMERGMMDEILKEQAFQQSGACNTSECQVQVGQLLGVDRMVVGSIGLLGGSIYTVSARILDVATGEVLKTVSEDYQGNIAGVLSQAMPRVASKLAGSSVGSAVSVQTSSLLVGTRPAGARVVLDGLEQTGTTPLALKNLAPGKHRIAVRKDNLLGSQTVLLKAGTVAEVNVPLELGTGMVVVASSPAGAAVWLDGDSVGLAPMRLQCTAEKHSLELRKNNYLPFVQGLSVNVGSVDSIHAELKLGTGMVVVASSPAGAAVWLDGDSVGLAPIRLQCSAGKHSLELRKDNYLPLVQDFSMNMGRVDSIHAELKLGTGMVVVASSPAGATVWLDGDSVGLAPMRLQCTAEKHSLELRKDDYLPLVGSVVVNAGRVDSVYAELKPGVRLTLQVTPEDAQVEINGKLTEWKGSQVFTPGLLDVRVSKGSGMSWSRYEPWQKKIDLRENQALQVSLNKIPPGAKKKAALWVWGGSVALGVVGMVFNAQGDSHLNTYEAATDKSAGEDAYNSVKTADLYRNIAYSVALTGLVTGVVLWLRN